MKPPSTLSRMLVAGQTKALSTFSWFFADVSMYSISQSRASFRASFRVTTLSSIISVLLPTSTSTTSLLPLFRTSSTHRTTFRNVSFLVRSNTTNAAALDRQQERVIVLNSSWPAVSQICSFTTLLPMLMFLDPYSTPMVYSWWGWKLPSMKRLIRLVFPTPVSPTRMNLKEQSNLLENRQSWCIFCAKLNTDSVQIGFNRKSTIISNSCLSLNAFTLYQSISYIQKVSSSLNGKVKLICITFRRPLNQKKLILSSPKVQMALSGISANRQSKRVLMIPNQNKLLIDPETE